VLTWKGKRGNTIRSGGEYVTEKGTDGEGGQISLKLGMGKKMKGRNVKKAIATRTGKNQGRRIGRGGFAHIGENGRILRGQGESA